MSQVPSRSEYSTFAETRPRAPVKVLSRYMRIVTFLGIMVVSCRVDGGAVPCHDVRTVDFRNLTITYGERTFAFKNGTALNRDLPGTSAVPDWRAKIEHDAVVQPAPGVFVRFLLIHDVHESGSGWRYYLVGYRCSNGRLQEVFARDGLSLGIDRLESSELTVRMDTTPGDAVTKCWSYAWDRDKSGYIVSSSWSHLTSTQVPGNLPAPGLPKRFTGIWTTKIAGTDRVFRECTLLDGQLHGVQRSWHLNGRLKTEGAWVNGKQNGRHANWDETGVLTSEQWWRSGEQHGPIREWHYGFATLDGNYTNNLKDGRWIVRDWRGQLIADGTYDMGKPVTGTFIIQEGKGMRVDRYQNGEQIEKGVAR
jgi:hypothetical protein